MAERAERIVADVDAHLALKKERVEEVRAMNDQRDQRAADVNSQLAPSPTRSGSKASGSQAPLRPTSTPEVWCADCDVWTAHLRLVGETWLCDPCWRTWLRVEALHAQ